jgi:hypothetical protein
LNNGQIKELFPKQKIEILNTDPSSISNAVKSIDQGTSLWKVCLILALVFFATEILLIRYYNKAIGTKLVDFSKTVEMNWENKVVIKDPNDAQPELF